MFLNKKVVKRLSVKDLVSIVGAGNGQPIDIIDGTCQNPEL